MRRFIVAGLVAICLTAGTAPASGAILTTPIPTDVWLPEEQSNPNGPVIEAVDWVWDQMLDRFTVPLAPDDQNIRPTGPGREQWIIAAAPPGESSNLMSPSS